jgi:hypothetical protein
MFVSMYVCMYVCTHDMYVMMMICDMWKEREKERKRCIHTQTQWYSSQVWLVRWFHSGLLAEWVIAFMHMSNYYYYYYYSYEKYILVYTRHAHSRQQSNDGTQRLVAYVT